MKTLFLPISFLFFVLFSTHHSQAQPYLEVTQIASVSSPVKITAPDDGTDRLFIVEKAGRIRIYDQNTQTLLAHNFLDISAQVSDSGERGLLGLAFHPEYSSNGYFFVNYTDNAGDTKISRFEVSSTNPDSANATTELIIQSVDQPYSNHNGGDLAFGPDGYLYIPLGDGGSGGDPENRSQNPQELLGKLVRIDIDNTSSGNNYAIPPDNPFEGIQTPVDTLDEIWALGLRNPWRFSFDRSTGDIWIADVGQGAWEEVSFQPAASTGGENYGWRCYEGNHAYNTSGCGPMSDYDFPVFEYPHNPSTGGFSVTGGYVYRGNMIPFLQGWYLMADYSSANFWLIRPNGVGGWDAHLQTDVPITSVSTFGEDAAGELYVASLNGQVYSISASFDPCPVDSTLTINPVNLDTVSASNNLTTEGTVTILSNDTVSFRAGAGVTLAANFSIQLGAEFYAYIEDCSADFAGPTTDRAATSAFVIYPVEKTGWLTELKDGKLQIKNDSFAGATFRAVDEKGRQWGNGMLAEQSLVDLSAAPAGVYFISVNADNETAKCMVLKK